MSHDVDNTLFSFREPSDLPRGEGWRALDEAVARWVLAHGGSQLLAEVAAWASYAEAQGDSALPLTAETPSRYGLRILRTDELQALAGEPLLAVLAPDESQANAPFILQAGHFYLRRNALHEIAIAEALQARKNSVALPSLPWHAADRRALFAEADSPAVQAQISAATQVLGRRLFVLTGGPGTGKTTTVLRMLLTLTRNFHAAQGGMPIVRLAAPTGKAARRLGEALREGMCILQARPEFMHSDWPQWLMPAQQAEAMTLHRLLGSRGQQFGFSRHSENLIDADIVLIDEASMLDIPLLRALLEALPETAVLVLVGDAQQLPPVGTGSVFLDVVTALEATANDHVVRLQHSFRANQELVAVNAALCRGDFMAFIQACQRAGERVQCLPCHGLPQLKMLAQQWYEKLHAAWVSESLFTAVVVTDVAAMFSVLRERQLLCALREGVFGAEQVNVWLDQWFRRSLAVHAAGMWYPGRVVMITRNDASSSLFNGDIGLCLSDASGQLRVWFEESSHSMGAGVRAFAPDALPPYEVAFAITVHKSQGSEYEHVAVLLPPDPGNAVLSRQLLYTAASRARQSLTLWCGEAVLQATLAADDKRSTGLPWRLKMWRPRQDLNLRPHP